MGIHRVLRPTLKPGEPQFPCINVSVLRIEWDNDAYHLFPYIMSSSQLNKGANHPITNGSWPVLDSYQWYGPTQVSELGSMFLRNRPVPVLQTSSSGPQRLAQFSAGWVVNSQIGSFVSRHWSFVGGHYMSIHITVVSVKNRSVWGFPIFGDSSWRQSFDIFRVRPFTCGNVIQYKFQVMSPSALRIYQ